VPTGSLMVNTASPNTDRSGVSSTIMTSTTFSTASQTTTVTSASPTSSAASSTPSGSSAQKLLHPFHGISQWTTVATIVLGVTLVHIAVT
jgi:hypothetical protein